MSDAPAEPTTAAPTALRVGFVSDTGRTRERNEDAYALHLGYRGEPNHAPVDAFFAVADGMGGHECGDVASRYVADAVHDALTAGAADFPSTGAEIGGWIEAAVQRVNRGLIELASESGTARSMGSTLTLAVLWRRTLFLAHVGDSRCYRLRAGVLRQLTEDHSWVAEQQRAGLLSAEEAAVHPNRNWLTQCLGIDREPRVFQLEQPVVDGDRYLLCSDGLHGVLDDARLLAVLAEGTEPQPTARRLVELANDAGGPDNVTAIVFDVRGEPPHAPPPPPPPPPRDVSLADTLPGLPLPRRASRRRAATLLLLVLALAGLGGWWVVDAGRAPTPEAGATPPPRDPPAAESPAADGTASPPTTPEE